MFVFGPLPLKSVILRPDVYNNRSFANGHISYHLEHFENFLSNSFLSSLISGRDLAPRLP